jgi:hypothetical protein
MRKALQEFRDAMHREGELSTPPTLQAILKQPVLQWRWAVAAMVVIGLGAIPGYRDAQTRQRAAEQQLADAQLLEQVNRALERSVPAALSVLLGN